MEPTAPIAPSQKSTAPQEKEAPMVRVIRTMKSDIADAIAKQNETAASIALAEAKKQERERAAALAAAAVKQTEAAAIPPPKRRGRIALIIILILILVGGRILLKLFAPIFSSISISSINIPTFGTPSPEKPTESTLVKSSLAPAILVPQTEKRFALSVETAEHISAGIAVERTAGITSGNIKNFYFANRSATGAALAKDLFVFMGTRTPDEVLRSLDTRFMLGLLGEEGSVATPFIILKITDYDIVRPGMLTWESSLAQDFDTIFGTKIATGAMGSTKFNDIVVAMKDARVLGTASSGTIFYTFVDSHTVIITSSRSALEQLIQRLANI